jgi:hypothetical protein
MDGDLNDGLHDFSLSPLTPIKSKRLTDKANIAALLNGSNNDFGSRFDDNTPKSQYKTVSTRDVEKGVTSLRDSVDELNRGNNYGYQET